jgi:hypothetical protein
MSDIDNGHLSDLERFASTCLAVVSTCDLLVDAIELDTKEQAQAEILEQAFGEAISGVELHIVLRVLANLTSVSADIFQDRLDGEAPSDTTHGD